MDRIGELRMKCPKCGADLKGLFLDDEQTQPFTLEYGRKFELKSDKELDFTPKAEFYSSSFRRKTVVEPAYECSANCPGIWTKTSIRLYKESKRFLKRQSTEEK